ncbi:DNA recombination protein RmuC [Paracoccus suum]|uniref:DNA recombination protein RmuC homolog n=2 Tax=Paracoccus suum TaxID=2259340 RepID=A0A344PL71_9RHOB|nr:DNA recombination protein RmuC [Paracoccus suum]
MIAIVLLLAVLGLLLFFWRGAVGTAARARLEAEARLRAAEERLAAAREGLEVAANTQRGLEARLADVSDAREVQALRAAAAETRAESLAGQLADRAAERDSLAGQLRSERDAANDLRQQLGEARLAAQKDAEAMAREIATLRGLRQEMTDQFRLLADETLKSTGTALHERHAEQLSALLTPFRDQVATFQTELQNREDQSNRERARLGEQIRLLHERSEQISVEAVALTRALKGEKQRQGAWGEMILARLLEDSGLDAGVHYLTQESRRDEEGKLWRPDVIVRLPQKKVLVVDSKVSLNAYAEATEAEDPLMRAAALKRHVAAVRTHVQTLSDKGYERLDEGSVDYVMMFMPIEGAYAEAVRADGDLVSWAMQRRVAVMTPATLMLALRIVDHIWTVERRESNAAAIADRAGALYDKFALFIKSMNDVGTALSRAHEAHGIAMGRLTSGPGNITGQIEKLRLLGARAKQRIGIEFDGGDDEDEQS